MGKVNLLYNTAKKESLTQCSVLLNKNFARKRVESLAVSGFLGVYAYIQPYSYGFMHRHPKNAKVPIFTEITACSIFKKMRSFEEKSLILRDNLNWIKNEQNFSE
jgi:hypothetical protein